MARNKNSKRTRRGNNFSHPTATRRVHRPPSSKTRFTFRSPGMRSIDMTLADGRVWHPEGAARPVYDDLQRPVSRVVLRDVPRVLKTAESPRRSKKRGSKPRSRAQAILNRFGPNLDRQTKAIVAFADPRRIPLCIARSVRTRVLHAFNRVGAGNKRPRFRPNSGVSC